MTAKKKAMNIKGEIDHALEKLAELSPDSEDYERAAKNLKLLSEAKKSLSLDVNMIFGVGSTILEILLILYFEQVHVLSSKAIGFVFRHRM